jgi:hypothetical protein
MPYKTTIEDHGLLTQWWGRVTIAELIRMQEEGHAHPDFDAIRYSIHDFSACDHLAYEQGGVEYSAAIDGAAGRSNAHIKIAVVAANAAVLQVVKGYKKAGLSPFPMRLFPSLDEARAWVKGA